MRRVQRAGYGRHHGGTSMCTCMSMICVRPNSSRSRETSSTPSLTGKTLSIANDSRHPTGGRP